MQCYQRSLEPRQASNDDTWTKTFFRHALGRSDFQQIGYPGAAFFIHARHDHATQVSEETCGRPNMGSKMFPMVLIEQLQSAIHRRTGQCPAARSYRPGGACERADPAG